MICTANGSAHSPTPSGPIPVVPEEYMGQSIILLKKEFLELTVEIDRDTTLEMSTGFGSNNRVIVSTSMPVTFDELEDIAKELTILAAELKTSWKCPNCNAINRKEWTECNTCDGGGGS
jgi:hypothetical protein